MGYFAGVDLGASKIRAVVAADDRVVGSDRRETPGGPTGVAITEAVLSSLRTACDEADVDPGELQAVGIAAAGLLDLAEGVLESPPNIPGADAVPLVGPVENLVDAPVTLRNDADAGVLGERTFGDRTPENMVYLTISTGIGAGVCVDGSLVSGWDGNAGEVGHLPLDPCGEMTCGCGRAGHWEAYCSGANIPRYASHLHEAEGVPTELPLEDLSAADVFDATDDPLAERVVDRVGEWNAQGVASLVHAFAPMVVYVGGGVALNNPERVLGPVRERLPDLVLSNVPDVQSTSLGDEVVVLGALASARISTR